MKKSNIIFLICLICLIVIIILSIPFSKLKKNDSGKINIYVSNYAIEQLVDKIGGDKVNVKNIYPIDSDPHSYEVSTKTAKEITNTNIVFYITKDFDKVIYNLSKSDEDTNYVNITQNQVFKDNVDKKLYKNGEIVNEHIWVSPKKLKVISTVIYNELINYDSQNKDYYEKNYNNVESRLTKIDNEYKEFANNQTIEPIITHDAYFYLNHDYGIKYKTLYGPEHSDEPSTKLISNIDDYITTNNIKEIFVEQTDTTNKIMKNISNETNTNIKILNNISTQSSLDEFKSMDLFDILENNLKLLKEVGLNDKG